MKKWQFYLLVGAVIPLAFSLPGCHNAAQQGKITKENFGYPGQPVAPGWIATMQKMRANQAAKTAQAKAAQANQAVAPPPKP